RWPRDWSSDVCSSDLLLIARPGAHPRVHGALEEQLLGLLARGRKREVAVLDQGAGRRRVGEHEERHDEQLGVPETVAVVHLARRSEERRVGKEWRSGA